MKIISFSIIFQFIAYLNCFSSVFTITSSNISTLQSVLENDNSIIELVGSINLNTIYTISSRTNVKIIGKGAVLNLGGNFGFKIQNSSNISFEGFQMNDTSSTATQNLLFNFITSTNSGLQNISYNSIRNVKNFCFIRTGSVKCYVQNCNINNIGYGIWLGDNGDNCNYCGPSPYMEPVDHPTSQCLIQNNKISNFIDHGIATRAVNPGYRAVTNSDFILNHIIKNNYVSNPNTSANYNSSVNIEVWGDDNIIENNFVIANPTKSSMIGISIGTANRNICRGNRVSGAFSYQGIEIVDALNTIVSQNIVDGIIGNSPLASDISGAGIGVNANTGLISKGTIVSDNQILNCKYGMTVTEKTSETQINGNFFKSSSLFGVHSVGGQMEIRGNRFDTNGTAIHNVGGSTTDIPNQIISNSFSRTTNNILYNENLSGSGRPFVFSNNLVTGWGNASFPEALIMQCGKSIITENTFINVGRTFNVSPSEGSPVPVVALKFIGYNNFVNVFSNNHLFGVQLSISTVIGGTFQRGGINCTNCGGWWSSPDFVVNNESL